MDHARLARQGLMLLVDFYTEREVFITELRCEKEDRPHITALCHVPRQAVYAHMTRPYVTAEQHIRCFSQACYALLFMESHRGTHKKLVDSVTFRQLMFAGDMWYRHMHLRFRENILRGTAFQMRVELEDVRTVRHFTVATLSAHGPARIEAEFVARTR